MFDVIKNCDGPKQKRVLIIFRIIAPYRVRFYEGLRVWLKSKGVELSVIYGQPSKQERDPYTDLGYGTKVKSIYFYFGNRFVVWLPALKYVRGSDLVIVQHGNKNLINYLLIPLRKAIGFKLGFWGHGRNFQARVPNNFEELFKRFYSVSADYWFAYTDVTKRTIKALGFPEDKISVVNNAIDTKELIALANNVATQDTKEGREKYHITENSSVGIFCSRLYHMKRLKFLLESVMRVKQEVEDFHFLLIGDGPQRPFVEEFSHMNCDWFHYVGPRYGEEKVLYFSLAQFQLMPGAVGLNIVDSFALTTPIVTTDIPIHGPEIAYLENGINGVMTDNSIEAYVSEIARLCEDKSYRERLVDGCRKARDKYTIENMVENFGTGIMRALSGS